MKNATSRGLNHFLPPRFREDRGKDGDPLIRTLEEKDEDEPRSRAVAEEEEESIFQVSRFSEKRSRFFAP